MFQHVNLKSHRNYLVLLTIFATTSFNSYLLSMKSKWHALKTSLSCVILYCVHKVCFQVLQVTTFLPGYAVQTFHIKMQADVKKKISVINEKCQTFGSCFVDFLLFCYLNFFFYIIISSGFGLSVGENKHRLGVLEIMAGIFQACSDTVRT